jgi:four helix bundle protein
MSKTITIRLDDKLAEMLDLVLDGTEETKSQIIRDALRRQLSIRLKSDEIQDGVAPYPLPGDDEPSPGVSDSSSDTTRQRAFEFAIAIVKLCRQLEDERHYVLAKQLLRAGTSVGANIEEAGAAQSRRDFLHKMAIASKEARETNYWLRLLDESAICPEVDLGPYLDRSLELIRLLTAIVKTTARTVR